MTQVVDFVALGWVEQNLREELLNARTSLQRFQHEPEQGQHLLTAQGHIRCAMGALRLCALEPAALLCAEIEQVLNLLAQGKIPHHRQKAAMTEVAAAIEALPAYVANVRGQRAITPAGITHVVNDLRAASGRPMLPASFFFNPPIPERAGISGDAVPRSEEDIKAFATTAMRVCLTYSKGVLLDDAEAQREVRSMAGDAIVMFAGATMERYFRCYAALVDLLAARKVVRDEVVIDIFKHCFSTLRNIASEGYRAFGHSSVEACTRKMLYYIAKDPAPNACQSKLLDEFGIDDVARYTAVDEGRMIQEADQLDALQQTLQLLVEVMSFLASPENAVHAGNSTLGNKVVPGLQQVGLQLHVVGLPEQAAIVNEQYKLLREFSKQVAPVSRTELVDFGGALAGVRDLLEFKLKYGLAAEGDTAALSMNAAITEQVARCLRDIKNGLHREFVRHDLAQLMEVSDEHFDVSIGGLRPLFRAARLLGDDGLLQAAERWEDGQYPAAGTLRNIARKLSSQFGDEVFTDQAVAALAQVQTVLGMLEERQRERDIFNECAKYLSNSIRMGGLVNDNSMQCFAETIAALEQYMEARIADPAANPDQHLVRAEANASKLQNHLAQRANRMNPESNVLDFGTQVTADKVTADKSASAKEVTVGPVELEYVLPPEPVEHTLQIAGEGSSEDTCADTARVELQSNQSPNTDAVAQTSSALLPWRDAMATWANVSISREPMPLPEGSNAEFDAELLECFVEECGEYVQKLQHAAPKLVAAPTDESVFMGIRAVFHTAKGSARTIGLAGFGQFMYSMETLFNSLRDGFITGSAELAEFHAAVVSRLPQFVALIGQRIELREDDFRIPGTIADAMATKRFADDFTVEVDALPPCNVVEEQLDEEPSNESQDTRVQEPLPYCAATWREQSSAIIIATTRTQLAEVAANEDPAIVEQADRLIQAALPALLELRDARLLDINTGNLAYLLDLDRLEHFASGAIYGLKVDADGKRSKYGVSEDSLGRLEAYLNEIRASEALAAVHGAAQRVLITALALEESGHGEDEQNTAQTRPNNVVPIRDASQAGGVYLVEDIDEELLDLFIETLGEYTDSIDEAMAGLSSGNAASLRGLKSTLHTVKGSANSVGLRKLGALTHELESKLSLLEMAGNPCEESTVREIDALIGVFIEATNFVSRHKIDWQEGAAGFDESANDVVNDANHAEADAESTAETLRVDTHRVDRLLDMGQEISVNNVRCREALDAATQERNEVQGLARHIVALVDRLSLQLDTEIQAKTEAMPDGGQFDPLEMDRITEKQGLAAILREAAYDLEEETRSLGRHLDNAVREAQGSGRLLQSNQSDLRQLRLVKFSKFGPGFRRLVHQVSRQLGKQVEFDFSPGRGGLDIRVFEQLRTALEHMLRNAIDHGLGTPEERRAEGKSEEGSVKLTIHREGSEFVIVLLDDGSGLNPEKLRAQARRLGMLKAHEEISDAEALRLILRPGFTTAAKLTDISGRGVGMDAVHQSITQAGGTVSIESRTGYYTRFVIRMPASILVNEALLAIVGEEQIAIPLTSLKGTEYHRRNHVFAQASIADGRITFRDEQYEVRYLGAVRGTAAMPNLDEMPDFVPVFYAQHNRRRVAFYADGMKPAEDMVIRSLGAQYAGVPGIAGGAVKSDGQPVLALDLNDFIRQVDHADKLADRAATATQDSTLVLCVDDSVMMRRTYEKRLESLGYKVVTAVDGAAALDYLSQAMRLPDFIFTDLEMPNMNGFEFIRNLRMNSSMAGIPTVVVSSRDADKHRAEALRVGASGFMGKGSNSAEGMHVVIQQHLSAGSTAMVS